MPAKKRVPGPQYPPAPSDTVPAMLTPGERVMNVPASRKHAATLDRWNNEGMKGKPKPKPKKGAVMAGAKGYAGGGIVQGVMDRLGAATHGLMGPSAIQQSIRDGTYARQAGAAEIPPPPLMAPAAGSAPAAPAYGGVMGAAAALRNRGRQIDEAVGGYADGGVVPGTLGERLQQADPETYRRINSPEVTRVHQWEPPVKASPPRMALAPQEAMPGNAVEYSRPVMAPNWSTSAGVTATPGKSLVPVGDRVSGMKGRMPSLPGTDLVPVGPARKPIGALPATTTDWLAESPGLRSFGRFAGKAALPLMAATEIPRVVEEGGFAPSAPPTDPGQKVSAVAKGAGRLGAAAAGAGLLSPAGWPGALVGGIGGYILGDKGLSALEDWAGQGFGMDHKTPNAPAGAADAQIQAINRSAPIMSAAGAALRPPPVMSAAGAASRPPPAAMPPVGNYGNATAMGPPSSGGYAYDKKTGFRYDVAPGGVGPNQGVTKSLLGQEVPLRTGSFSVMGGGRTLHDDGSYSYSSADGRGIFTRDKAGNLIDYSSPTTQEADRRAVQAGFPDRHAAFASMAGRSPVMGTGAGLMMPAVKPDTSAWDQALRDFDAKYPHPTTHGLNYRAGLMSGRQNAINQASETAAGAYGNRLSAETQRQQNAREAEKAARTELREQRKEQREARQGRGKARADAVMADLQSQVAYGTPEEQQAAAAKLALMNPGKGRQGAKRQVVNVPTGGTDQYGGPIMAPALVDLETGGATPVMLPGAAQDPYAAAREAIGKGASKAAVNARLKANGLKPID